MLSAAWLGSWTAPWGLDRGRRWGDPAWALAALSQAWLLGGHEGRWPRLDQEARRPSGPRTLALPESFSPRPAPEWVARLRHGSPGVPAHQRGPREDELAAWCWQALLEGDGAPWMSAGAVLLDRATRLRWIPLLGAVDAEGRLHLPPFLAVLVPGALHALPPGWWARLLGGMDATGRLLPEGPLDPDLPWPRIQPHAGPLVLEDLPADLAEHRSAPWLQALPGGAWMLDPRLRAWSRGPGASPEGLGPVAPRGLAAGDAPETGLLSLLGLAGAEGAPAGWEAAVSADVREELQRPPCPPPSGHPVWDRIRVRWGGEPPGQGPAYPAWGAGPHPCADPFHWMAEGLLAHHACDTERSLRAFTWAHAHFLRLGARGWAARAASNAAAKALLWADLPGHARWAVLRGPLPSPWRELEAAQLMEVHRGPAAALAAAQDLVAAQPGFPEAWGLLASAALDLGREELIREALPQVAGHPFARLLEAALGPLAAAPPPEADAETRFAWEALRLLRGSGDPTAAWIAWEACPNQIMRLELGLQILECRSDLRTPDRLLALQAIADRADSARHQARLGALWPLPPEAPDPAPRALLSAWLSARPHPTWLAWEEDGRLEHLGSGDPPPEGALTRLAQDGALAPFSHGGWIWRGLPLVWEGSPVGVLLLALPGDAHLGVPVEPLLLAPWLARARGRRALPPDPAPGLLLTDGSEPMASVLRELDRVAASELPVLVLGPTGSGKELAARELHQRSGRSGPLVAVNCSAFAEGLLESELFGHVKGAFTGAHQDRRGAIEAARGGTLFLDEVADLSPRLQSLLLRVLQEREIRRVGSDHAIRVDVRFVAATHRPLETLAETGAFRRDLLFRLEGAVLRLPALSARRHEFPFLLPHLVVRAAESARRPVPALAPGLPQALARRPWPGNVRELLHALERAILRCEDGVLAPRHFPELDQPGLQEGTWDEATRAFQRRFLLETLRNTGFQATEAARALGLARPALYTAAKRLGVDLVAERERWSPPSDLDATPAARSSARGRRG
jgi:transcriptional regulator with AAA-type ATPase domain